MANQMGKRYMCTVCEATVLVTKAGDGELMCHAQVMEMPAAAPLPSSD
jgi:Desulfoferrodoxin, N-terminal domain